MSKDGVKREHGKTTADAELNCGTEKCFWRGIKDGILAKKGKEKGPVAG